MPVLLGIDWGSSNRRAYVLDRQGRLLRRHADGEGILHVDGNFEASLRALMGTLQVDQAEVLMSGMVGSRNGWQEVAYLDVAHPLTRLGEALHEIPTGLIGTRCRIVPGYRFLDRHGMPDVIRGEEIQVFGALRLGAPEGWFVLPGTHSKWVHVEGGRITEFRTYMTGEFYATLRQHGLLAKLIESEDAVPEAFHAGLQAARQGSFTHMAFCCRALVVTDMMPARHTASYLSGLLIGCELHDILQTGSGSPGNVIQIVGSPGLEQRYADALAWAGLPTRIWQPDEAYLAALRALAEVD